MSYEPFSWPSEEHHTERAFLRNWRGMPPRAEWNSDPARAHERICPSCGYKWQVCEFQDHRCWNCFMCESQPHQEREFWDKVDANNAPPKMSKGATPAQVKIKRLGDTEVAR